MKGFTLIELLLGISFFEPLQVGVMEGYRSGILGAAVGALVGFMMGILWIALFYSWINRNLEKLKTSRVQILGFLSTVFFMMFALPVMAWTITHQLTTPFYR
jgi:hypothetical protein